jgi:hypothetical protein
MLPCYCLQRGASPVIPCCFALALLVHLITQVSSLPTLTINTNANGTLDALHRLSFVVWRGVERCGRDISGASFAPL